MASIIRRRKMKGENSLKMTSYHDSTMQSIGGSSQRSVSDNVTNFQNAMKLLLSDSDRDQMTDILAYYHTSRNVYHMVTSLENVLDTPVKRKLLPVLRQVLPKRDRQEFDRYTLQGNLYAQPNNNGTDDSGIGSNTTTNHNSGMRTNKGKTKSKSQYVQGERDHSQSSSSKSSSFGSAVRRKVKAAMQQRGRSAERSSQPIHRRRHSFTAAPDPPESRQHFDPAKVSLTVPRTRGKLSPFWPRDAYDDVKVIFLNKRCREETMGFSIRGGAEHNLGIFISHVEMGSSADECGLLLGDQILRVNNTPFLNDVTHERAVKTLADGDGKVVLYVRSVGQVPDAVVTSHNFAWTGPDGRPASPPPDAIYGAALGSRFNRSDLRLLLANERRVNLTVAHGQRLGLMVRGGAEYGLGIYITGVESGSASDQAGLKPGDQVLEVNNVSFKSISHADAVNVIRSNRMLMMMIRYVGRIPQCHVSREETKWMSDEQISYHSLRMSRGGTLHRRPGSALGVFQRGLTGSDQVTLRHPSASTSLSMSSLETALARIMGEVEQPGLLTDAELDTVRYYVSEYVMGHVSVDALALSLAQLLNTHEKFALMNAVRRCLFTRDIDRFDLLVLRREVELLTNRHARNSNDQLTTSDENQRSRETTRRNDQAPPQPRSRSLPPAPRSHGFPIERRDESLEAHTSGQHVYTTPIDAAGDGDNLAGHVTPRIVVTSTPLGQGKGGKALSPIFRDNSSVLPTPMKLIPPMKPKRAAVSATNDSGHEAWSNIGSGSTTLPPRNVARDAAAQSTEYTPIYSTVNKRRAKMNEKIFKETYSPTQQTPNSSNSAGPNPSHSDFFRGTSSRYPAASSGHLFPRKSDFAAMPTLTPTTHIRERASPQRAPSPFTAAVEKQASGLTPAATRRGDAAVGIVEPRTKSKTQTNIVTDPRTSAISVHRINNNVHIIESPDSEADLLPPPPMSFLNGQGELSQNRNYSVHVDVHRSSGNRTDPGYKDMASESSPPKKSVTISANATAIPSFHSTMQSNNNSNVAVHEHPYDHSVESDDYDDSGVDYEDVIDPREYLRDVEKQKVIIFKVAPTLGLSVEGGANTRQPLPRISSVQPGGCAHMCGRLLPGQVIHEVNGTEMAGLEHKDVARAIAIAFKTKDRDSVELLVSGPHENGTL